MSLRTVSTQARWRSRPAMIYHEGQESDMADKRLETAYRLGKKNEKTYHG